VTGASDKPGIIGRLATVRSGSGAVRERDRLAAHAWTGADGGRSEGAAQGL